VAAFAVPTAAGDLHARTPLRVLKANGRYFAHGSEKAVYLTGSHTWTNLIDASGGCSPGGGRFDYVGYLKWLRRHNHNFIRLSRFELTRFDECGAAVRTRRIRGRGPGRARRSMVFPGLT
jgi:hypothetical protein